MFRNEPWKLLIEIHIFKNVLKVKKQHLALFSIVECALLLKRTVTRDLFVKYCNPLEFLLKQFHYSSSFSMSDSKLAFASFNIP